MNVSLTPKLDELVQAKVASGLYNSASEVIREALRLLDERDRLREARIGKLRTELAVGLEQLERGQAREYDKNSLKQVADAVKANGRKRISKQKNS